MANTYTQLYIQLVFEVHGRHSLIRKDHEEYIAMLRKFEIEFNEKYLFEWIDY